MLNGIFKSRSSLVSHSSVIFIRINMLLLNKIFLLAAFLYLFDSGYSQSTYYFRHYQVENGLSNNAVICSLQDKKGFLWFGTKDGLNRFDGYSFKIFRNDPDDSVSIGSNFIHCLYEDRNGILWVGTENGLYKYDAPTERFIHLDISNNAPIRAIQMDIAGNLWFIIGFTLIKYNENTGKARYYDIPHYFEATSICLSADGNIWVSTTLGKLEKYYAINDSFESHDLFINSGRGISKWIEKIFATTNRQILIGTSNQGAKLYNIASSTYRDILTYNKDKTEIFARNFVQTTNDECWIATETGIFIYNLKTGNTINLAKKYNDAYSISDNAVYTFCKDMEGGIWVGTYFGGISYYPKQQISFNKYYPMAGINSLSGNVVREIHQDNYKNLWIGTEDGGLNKMDISSGRFIAFKPSGNKNKISYTNIHGLLIDKDELWIGTFEHGLDVMNIRTGKVIRHYAEGNDKNALQSNFIYCLYKSNSGEIMVGTTRGAYAYNKRKDNFSPLPGIPLLNWYSCILKDDKNIIWTGTYGNGINYYNTITKDSGNFSYSPFNKNSISSNRINSIFQDSKRNLWFATEGGLCKYQQQTKNFKRYTTKNGFPTNFILSILEDSHQRLWISTSKGLVCFNPGTEQINIYTKESGLLNDQFNFSSAFKDDKGKMYFGSVKGFISFHPDEEKNDSFIPPIYITDFQVNNTSIAVNQPGSPLKQSITYTSNVTLKHDQATFSIDFASLSYTAPAMSNYTYIMEGLQNDWIYLKQNRKVYFTELAAGTYKFKIKATNYNGKWNDNTASLVITILPPWWASKWAYLIYLLICVLIIYLFTKNYHQRIKEKNKIKIEHLEIQKDKELYEAKMDFFTNIAHEIKTPLTLIKGPLEKIIKRTTDVPEDIKLHLSIVDKNTNRLVKLTNQLLDFRQTEIKGFSINFVNANVSEITKEIVDNFKLLADQKNIQFHFVEVPGNLYAEIDVEAFEKILGNLLSNAIKYAKSKIEVYLLPVNRENNTFTIEIRNDGYLIPIEQREKIFEPFVRLKETEKQKGTGIGLALARSLTELHKGILNIKEPDNNMNTFFVKMPVYQQKTIEE